MRPDDDDPEDDYRERRARPGTEDELRLEAFRHPKAEATKVIGPNGHPIYATVVNARGIALTAHCSFDAPDELWISSRNAADDYRPIRLTVAEATALRDGLSLFIAEHSTSPTEKE